MTLISGVASVEITFDDGSVKHFRAKAGDIITMNAQTTTTPPYYTLLIAPIKFIDDSQKDVI